MVENKSSILASAIHFAIPLGLFWVFKYIFVILGDYSDLSKYIAQFLGIGTPIIYYVLICKYRDQILGGNITYAKSVKFSLLLFLFATFIELAIVCLHIFVINPTFLSQFTDKLYEMADAFKMTDNQRYMNQISQFTTNMGAYYIMSYIISNMITGLFLSLIISVFVSNKKAAK